LADAFSTGSAGGDKRLLLGDALQCTLGGW
jgi:hypothetical protein